FFVYGASTSPNVSLHQLWKYTYLSGDGSGAGGTWENRGGNLPTGTQFPNSGNLNTQSGYDHVICVKPTHQNFVILGGTNLYRSTNGFATTANTTEIGGYNFYPPHHPDLHAGAFSPTNPDVYYCAGDGGVHKAADINLANMLWTTLDHGYNVT